MSDPIVEEGLAESLDMIDAEARALMMMAHAFRGLDKKAIDRILKWAHERFVFADIVCGVETEIFATCQALREDNERLRRMCGLPPLEKGTLPHKEPEDGGTGT